MSLEADLQGLFGPLASDRAYPDTADGAPLPLVYPLIIYQQVGGEALWLSERAMPSHKHARMQVTTWARTRIEASTLGRSVETTLCQSDLIVRPYGALTATFNEIPKLYGTRQDFGIWYLDP